MAALLKSEKPQIFMLEDLFDDDDMPEYNPTPVSLWVKDRNMYKASTNITTVPKLEPGIYTVDFNREVGTFCKKLDTTSDELFTFSDPLITNLLTEIDLFWSKKDKYKENNLIHKRGILLEGFPGTGKSSIISLLAEQIINKGGLVFKVINWKNLEDYISFIREGLKIIQPDTPIITIIEDIDMYDSVETELLDFLDGKTNVNHHIIIATSNNTEAIPDTFLRPSRLDLKIEVTLPNEDVRKEYFQFKKVPEEDIENLVKESEGLSLADLKEIYICIYLLDYKISDAINQIANPKDKSNYLLKANINKVSL